MNYELIIIDERLIMMIYFDEIMLSCVEYGVEWIPPFCVMVMWGFLANDVMCVYYGISLVCDHGRNVGISLWWCLVEM